ncbi:hypothetical protein SAMN05216215_108729 [Saccharopolyspora shandongensis]|uniref:Uncharacterized protein n=2 Tax=Saccharopolyspora shandongensis TaxID=418495 RepID=A0A1H3TME2_9PSEU|nr:hypothetical protein SAMN05216215_108729 [Saccharopolyspora shandongensis]
MARQRDREQHAAKVAIWYEDGAPKYVNTSGLPIWSVEVLFNGASVPAERGCWPPAPDPVDADRLMGSDLGSQWMNSIRDAAERMKQKRYDDESEKSVSLRFPKMTPLTIVFTDGNNRRWRRDLDGTLSEIKQPSRFSVQLAGIRRLPSRVVHKIRS